MNWDILLFFKAWVRAPRKTGAIIPSSPILARAMAAQVRVRPGKKVLELGAGTGAVTHALLDAGVAADDLIVIEYDPVFCQRLRQRFPRALILNADATRLEGVLARHGITQVDFIVSSLPLLSLDRVSQAAIIEQCCRALAPEGVLLQYTYGFGSPVRTALRARHGIRGERMQQIWRNVPPATVWRYRCPPPLAQAAGRMAARFVNGRESCIE